MRQSASICVSYSPPHAQKRHSLNMSFCINVICHGFCCLFVLVSDDTKDENKKQGKKEILNKNKLCRINYKAATLLASQP